ncbi:MAG TPA: response regulator transcription factor [Anaerolineales bacterium]
MRIYIADDSAIVRKRLSAMLADVPGVELAGKAADAGQAYEEIQRLKPEIVILDLRMPGNGVALVERVNSLSKRPVVIVLTNYSSPPYRRRSLEAGADYFLDKSTDQEQLLRILYLLIAAPGQRPS